MSCIVTRYDSPLDKARVTKWLTKAHERRRGRNSQAKGPKFDNLWKAGSPAPTKQCPRVNLSGKQTEAYASHVISVMD